MILRGTHHLAMLFKRDYDRKVLLLVDGKLVEVKLVATDIQGNVILGDGALPAIDLFIQSQGTR